MIGRMITALLWAAVLALAASPAGAAILIQHADDVCAPTDDPCVIDDHYENGAPGGDLDFGLRTVIMNGTGRIDGATNLFAGALVTDFGASHKAFSAGSDSIRIRTRRACSGDGQTPCFFDSTCASQSLGTCSVGDGTITLSGGIVEANGDPGGLILLEAAGDITVGGTLSIDGSVGGADGGTVLIDSVGGSVIVTTRIKGLAGAAMPYDYEPDAAGVVDITAAGDVTIGAAVDLNGGYSGGDFEVEAGGNVIVTDGISCDSGFGEGGRIDIAGDGDVTVAGGGSDGNATTRLSATGGSKLGDYYHLVYPGPGGYATITGDDITVTDDVVIEAHTGFGGGGFLECVDAYAGSIYLYAGTGVTRFDGRIEAEGRSKCGGVGTFSIEGGHAISMAKTADVDLQGKVGGLVFLETDGPAQIYGNFNMRGRPKKGTGYYAYYGIGGALRLDATDVVWGGLVTSGSDLTSLGPLEFNVCRMRVTGDGRIDHTYGEGKLYDAGDAEGNIFRVQESFYAEKGSVIRAVEKDGESPGNVFLVRTADKLTFLGKVEPPPEIFETGTGGCPVCGNDEIDAGESCDDGNTTNGDGCRDDCQDEGCVADTPGYPGVDLCDDANECTVDVCDNVGHACVHTLDCSDGVACTVDNCVAGPACDHVATDSLCDDLNPCTDDMCNATTGCVYANLTGIACDDGDICTQTSTCSSGVCESAEQTLLAKTKLKAKFREGPSDDSLTIKADMKLEDYASDPTVTGLEIHVRDAANVDAYTAMLPAAGFEARGGAATKYLFLDKTGGFPSANGVIKASVRVKASAGLVRVVAKMRDFDVPGLVGQLQASLSLLFGTDPGSDDCATAVGLSCKTNSRKSKCSN